MQKRNTYTQFNKVLIELNKSMPKADLSRIHNWGIQLYATGDYNVGTLMLDELFELESDMKYPKACIRKLIAYVKAVDGGPQLIANVVSTSKGPTYVSILELISDIIDLKECEDDKVLSETVGLILASNKHIVGENVKSMVLIRHVRHNYKQLCDLVYKE